MSFFSVPRFILSTTGSPTLPVIAFLTEFVVVYVFPSISRIISPVLIPAASAGASFMTSLTTIPSFVISKLIPIPVKLLFRFLLSSASSSLFRYLEYLSPRASNIALYIACSCLSLSYLKRKSDEINSSTLISLLYFSRSLFCSSSSLLLTIAVSLSLR